MHDDDIPENPDELIVVDEEVAHIDFIEVDDSPVDPNAGDYCDDIEGEADGRPILSVFGSERDEGVE
jgi:hypothetical protein